MACTAQLPFLSVLCIVLSTDVTAIPLEEFYQYGSEAGDETVGRIDDGYGSTADDIIRVLMILTLCYIIWTVTIMCNR